MHDVSAADASLADMAGQIHGSLMEGLPARAATATTDYYAVARGGLDRLRATGLIDQNDVQTLEALIAAVYGTSASAAAVQTLIANRTGTNPLVTAIVSLSGDSVLRFDLGTAAADVAGGILGCAIGGEIGGAVGGIGGAIAGGAALSYLAA